VRLLLLLPLTRLFLLAFSPPRHAALSASHLLQPPSPARPPCAARLAAGLARAGAGGRMAGGRRGQASKEAAVRAVLTSKRRS